VFAVLQAASILTGTAVQVEAHLIQIRFVALFVIVEDTVQSQTILGNTLRTQVEFAVSHLSWIVTKLAQIRLENHIIHLTHWEFVV
jgi:hypothetical protein